MTLLSPLEGHRLWASTYDEEPNPLLALEFRMLSEHFGNLAGRRFIDVACGTGRWANYALQQGARVVGIDLCREMLLHCRAATVLADAARLPLPDEASDITVCAFAIGYMESPMAELARITKPGGSIFVSDVHPEALEHGWTRSFRRGAEVYQIEHRRYGLPELLHTSGLKLVRLLEPRFGDPERAIFRRAGKDAEFDEAGQAAAIYIAHWIRA